MTKLSFHEIKDLYLHTNCRQIEKKINNQTWTQARSPVWQQLRVQIIIQLDRQIWDHIRSSKLTQLSDNTNINQ